MFPPNQVEMLWCPGVGEGSGSFGRKLTKDERTMTQVLAVTTEPRVQIDESFVFSGS